MREVEHFKVVINGNKTIVERDFCYKDYKGEIKYITRTVESKNTDEDIYDERIGIVVAILKSLGFSRRIVGKISNVLLDEKLRFYK